jgi:hypothetical protein
MAKSNAERETIIRRAADEQDWEVYSEDPRVIRKLTGLFGTGRSSAQSDGKVWVLGPKVLSFRKPRVISEEQRQVLRERMAKARKGD